MTKSFCDNLLYLATKLHARRSRMQEGRRLEELCQIRTLPELGRAVGLEGDYQTVAEFQRRLVKDLIYELSSFVKHIGEAGGDVFSCLLLRFEMENAKVFIRALANKIPQDDLRSHVLPLPESHVLDAQMLMSAGSLENCCRARNCTA
ncbi:MAG TPA: V-type ATPase subunit [Verrucomicrobiae bacterium]|nr:V-type ATPase subunit [Verrucomicrobiae bacterium]